MVEFVCQISKMVKEERSFMATGNAVHLGYTPDFKTFGFCKPGNATYCRPIKIRFILEGFFNIFVMNHKPIKTIPRDPRGVSHVDQPAE